MTQLVYRKMRQMLITKCDKFITNCSSYCKMRWFYYKIQQFLQIATFITNCVGRIWDKKEFKLNDETD